MKNEAVLISHIIEAVGKINRYINGLTQDDLEKDDKTLDAVVRELIIIGEAAANISDKWKERHSDVPLNEAVGMRNRIVHEYWAVDTDVVWKTCKEDLPTLEKSLKNKKV